MTQENIRLNYKVLGDGYTGSQMTINCLISNFNALLLHWLLVELSTHMCMDDLILFRTEEQTFENRVRNLEVMNMYCDAICGKVMVVYLLQTLQILYELPDPLKQIEMFCVFMGDSIDRTGLRDFPFSAVCICQ